MTIKQFLIKNVEGYLFKDLRTMNRVKLKKGQKIGGVGYPVVASIVAGMELLGGLLQTKTFNPHDGTDYFENYWNNYFSKYDAKYKSLGDVFYKLVRHGLAHSYLTKTGIWIKKGDPLNHLRIINDSGDYYMFIDTGELFKDFINSYKDLVKPIVWKGTARGSVTEQTMQIRVSEMIKTYELESNKELAKLNTSKPVDHMSVRDMLSGPNNSLASGTVITYSGTNPKKF